MKIIYTVPFKGKLLIDDHWQIPFQGGSLRIIEENGYVKALELTFEKQPIEYAPRTQYHDQGKIAMTLSQSDLRMAFVKRQLDNAATFLNCIYDVDLAIDEIEARYVGENPEEIARISVKSSAMGRNISPLPLPFDMLTRALMVAERRDGPRFEATLARTARKALAQQEFINSFRYSFLLIESLYGGGQFKTAGLQAALKENREFRNMVQLAINNIIPAKSDRDSDTARLLATKPNIDDVIDHLVEKRGFYFHGNIRRKGAWKPDKQGVAESLSLLAIGIIGQITIKAADPLFETEFQQRHYEDAMSVGAQLVFNVNFRYRDPGENFDRNHQVEIAIPGIKPTSRTAFEVAQKCLEIFSHNQPASDLISVSCVLAGTNQKIFEFNFYIHASSP